MSNFELVKLPLGKAHLGLCSLPGLGGHLSHDLDRIADFSPALVVSLTETDEQAQLGVPLLAVPLAARGIAWRDFPIPDYGVPLDSADWCELSRQLQAYLANGRNILVHCRGGCGRSGMIALRLMVEMGEAADTAFVRLRAIRPCAIETKAQLVWATG